MSTPQSVSLSKLLNHVQSVIRINFDSPVWVRAEISDLRINNGHCYLELIEKDDEKDSIIAKSRANIWANQFRIIQDYFEQITSHKLKTGIKVLVMVSVEYHPVYGIGLNIKDIDPNFTLGELAARKQQILKQLEKDGVIDMNKNLILPTVPNKIAVISSATAAGYEDFCNQLHQNEDGFVFYHKLFPAIMQGDLAEASIITALEKIYNHLDLFDLVVIIRGGGASTDLSCFDSYQLALNCAQFPLPIISGIGHQRDFSVVDRVAFVSVKTPTAVAEYLIARIEEAFLSATGKWEKIKDKATQKIQIEKQSLNEKRWRLRQSILNKTIRKSKLLDQLHYRIKSSLHKNKHQNEIQFRKLDQVKSRLEHTFRFLIQNEKNKLSIIEKNIDSHSPQFLLQHGYTITTIGGKKISSSKSLKSGDEIRTWLHDGDFSSIVK